MANISDDLADIAISRSLVLQRYANGLSKQVAEHYTEMIDDIQTTILKSGNISNRLRQTIKDIKEQLSVPNFDNDFKELAQSEVNYTQKAYNSVIGIDLFKNIPHEGAMSAILNTSLIEGATIGSWLQDLENSQAFDVERAIKLGVTLGETNTQLASRLKNTMEVSMRNAQSIVITGASAIGNKARQDFYDANNDVIKSYQHLSALDGKTSDICISRSGLKWDIDKKPIGHTKPYQTPPLHFRCRSTIIPILKTWRELGIDEDELPTGTQSSDAGYLPQDYTFKEFLQTKSKEYQNNVLGVGRAELWRSGKISLSQLVNQQGKTLSLKELRGMSGGAVAVAKAVKVPDISFGYGGKFDKYVENIRDEAKIVIDKLPKPNEIIEHNYGGYNANLNHLKTTPNKITFRHEYGHHIDFMLAEETQFDTITISQKNIKKYFDMDKADGDKSIMMEVLNKKGDKYLAGLFDILDAQSNGVLHYRGYNGHGKEYWMDRGVEKEVFANMFELWSANEKEWEYTKQIFPNTSKEFERVMKEVIDGKFD